MVTPGLTTHRMRVISDIRSLLSARAVYSVSGSQPGLGWLSDCIIVIAVLLMMPRLTTPSVSQDQDKLNESNSRVLPNCVPVLEAKRISYQETEIKADKNFSKHKTIWLDTVNWPGQFSFAWGSFCRGVLSSTCYCPAHMERWSGHGL